MIVPTGSSLSKATLFGRIMNSCEFLPFESLTKCWPLIGEIKLSWYNSLWIWTILNYAIFGFLIRFYK